jgi:hypothetical protein
MVRVAPVHARQVVGGEAVLVAEGVARVDGDENVFSVALGLDMEAVDVQVGRDSQPVDELDVEYAPGRDPQCWSGNPTVVCQRRRLPAAEVNRPGGRFEADLQPPVAAAQFAWLGEIRPGRRGVPGIQRTVPFEQLLAWF